MGRGVGEGVEAFPVLLVHVDEELQLLLDRVHLYRIILQLN